MNPQTTSGSRESHGRSLRIAPTRHRRVIAAIVGTALLTACAGSDETADALRDTIVASSIEAGTTTVATAAAPTTTARPTTTATPTTTTRPTTTATPTTTTAPTTTVVTTTARPPSTVAAPAPNGAACLVGDWVINDADLATYFDTVEQNSSFQSISSSGEMRLTYTNTTYKWVNDYTLQMVFDGVSYESVNTGWFSGSYTEAQGIMTGTIDEERRSGTLTINGQPLVDDVGDLFVGINPARPMDAMKYSCDGPQLVLDAGPRAGAEYTIPLTRA